LILLLLKVLILSWSGSRQGTTIWKCGKMRWGWNESLFMRNYGKPEKRKDNLRNRDEVGS